MCSCQDIIRIAFQYEESIKIKTFIREKYLGDGLTFDECDLI